MKTRKLVINGYKVLYDPDHPKAMKSESWGGYIYEHIKLAEEMMQRPLRKGEEVHHLDFNRSNNRLDNLLVLEKSQHTKLHNWLRHHVVIKELPAVKPTFCKMCKKPLTTDQIKFCSRSCAGQDLSRRKVPRPDKETLAEDIESMNWVNMGKKYKVSDNAVRKWARTYGLL